MPVTPNVKVALFAEYTLFYASSLNLNVATKKLQVYTNLAVPWFKEWRISINPAKIQAIMFSNKSTAYKDKIKFENTTINWSTKTKYLSFTIDHKLNFVSHTK